MSNICSFPPLVFIGMKSHLALKGFLNPKASPCLQRKAGFLRCPFPILRQVTARTRTKQVSFPARAPHSVTSAAASQGPCLARGTQWVPQLSGLKGCCNRGNAGRCVNIFLFYSHLPDWKTRQCDFPKSLWGVRLLVWCILEGHSVCASSVPQALTKMGMCRDACSCARKYDRLLTLIWKVPWKFFHKAYKNNRVENPTIFYNEWTVPIRESTDLCPLEMQSDRPLSHN